MRKDSKHTDKTKRKISLSSKGHFVLEETRRKISLANKGNPGPWLGVKMSDETKRKIGLAHKGKKHTVMARKKMSVSMSGKNHPNYGKRLPESTRLKMKLANLGKKHKPSSIQKMKNARAKQVLPRKDTKPERFLQSILSVNGIKYRTHEPIKGQPDIFIEPNICVFVDGCYWHGCKECGFINESKNKRDESITMYLKQNDYEVVRFWEHEIYNDTNICLLQIIKEIECNSLYYTKID